jgi:hypothetical protein
VRAALASVRSRIAVAFAVTALPGLIILTGCVAVIGWGWRLGANVYHNPILDRDACCARRSRRPVVKPTKPRKVIPNPRAKSLRTLDASHDGDKPSRGPS